MDERNIRRHKHCLKKQSAFPVLARSVENLKDNTKDFIIKRLLSLFMHLKMLKNALTSVFYSQVQKKSLLSINQIALYLD